MENATRNSLLVCPDWCTTDHDEPDQQDHERAYGRHEHLRPIDSFGLHELWAIDDRVFRERILCGIDLRQFEPLGGGSSRAMAHLVLTTYRGWELVLTAHESRSVAAMLLHGADHLQGLR
jgi:hypothetical protein